MRRRGLDFVLVATPANVTYAAGFEAPLPVGFVAEITGSLPALALVSAAGDGVLVINDAEAGAAASSWLTERFTFGTLGQTEHGDPAGTFCAALGSALRAAGLAGGEATIGVEPALPRIASEVLATECPGAALRDATEALEEARRIKSPRELELLRGAIAAADAAQGRLVELAREGRAGTTDAALWAEAAAAGERLAARILHYSGAIVTGPDTADWRRGGPGGRIVEPGDPVLLDIGPRVSGYWADCATTVVFGAEPSREQQRYLTASREACLAGIDALRPGRRCFQAYDAVVAALGRHGVPMGHYAGHGIGVSVNEEPRLIPYDDTVIEAGMVFALEAGAYAGPGGRVGARSEKIALVTDGGPEILSAFAWD
jgi:Xaa-Pro aminopeptidase